MKAQTQILPPSNWQDFEELCKRIWEIKWNHPDDIIRNGRLGQQQNGVDISAYVEDKHGYCGIQCKGKDNFSDKRMTYTEIDEEINKAKSFKPTLKSLIFATTATKDANIEEYVRKRNIENMENGLFSVAIFSWEDIVSFIEQYKPVKEWYVYEKLQSYEPDIQILINGQNSTKKNPLIVQPKYSKQIIYFRYKRPSFADIMPYNSLTTLPFCETMKGNCIKLNFKIINNGEFLENCFFSVDIPDSNSYKFLGNNVIENIASRYMVDENHMETIKDFSLHSGFQKSLEVFIVFAEKPETLDLVLNCCFTSKQNKKPYHINIYIKSTPIIIEKTPKIIDTSEKNIESMVEIKPYEDAD